MPNKTNFGELVRSLMQTARISQKEFARRVGISESAISLIVSGGRPIPAGEAELWGKSLGLTGADLVTFIESMHVYAAGPIVLQLVSRLRGENADLRDVRDKCKRRMDQTQKAFDLMKEKIANAGE
jgi:transcriptional regulator with XRE-family HTH domain